MVLAAYTDLKGQNVEDWSTILAGASEILCTVLQETLTQYTLKAVAEEVLAKSIFTHVKQSLGYMWIPEDGE